MHRYAKCIPLLVFSKILCVVRLQKQASLQHLWPSRFMALTVFLRAENVRSEVDETTDNVKYHLSNFLLTSPRSVLETGILICSASQF